MVNILTHLALSVLQNYDLNLPAVPVLLHITDFYNLFGYIKAFDKIRIGLGGGTL